VVFLFDGSLRKLVVSHDVDNRSDHDPVFMHLAIDSARIVTGSRLFTPKLAWSKASEEDKLKFAESLRTYLDEIQIPYEAIMCHDFACSKPSHGEALDHYTRYISEACLLAGEAHFSLTCAPSIGRIPGWKEHVAPFREKSRFWHQL
jgi:hypothetical protein